MNVLQRTIKSSMVALACLTALGCGSSGSSNDQGVSFTLFGFYENVTCTTGIVGAIDTLSLDTESNGSGAGPVAYAGIQNNILSQGLRVRRAFYKFYVEGATVQPPPTTAPAGFVLGAAGEAPGGSLPDDFAQSKNIGCMGLQIIPTDILSYINLNRNQFPELPFTMRVEVTLRGITTSGNELDSNPLDFLVNFTQDNIITPGSGGDSSSSAAAIEEFPEDVTDDETIVEDGSGQL